MSKQELMNRIIDNAVQANELDPQTQRMAVAMFRLLAEGQPVSPARFADAVQIPVEVVDDENTSCWPSIVQSGSRSSYGPKVCCMRSLPSDATDQMW